MRIVATILILLIGSGCASMSAEECLTADWEAIGYEDGAKGASVSAVTSRRQACAKSASVTVDMAAYMTGRDMGLVDFCRPSNAYALGTRGGVYHGVCAGPEEREFVAAFESGRQLYSLTNAVASARTQIHEAQYDLAQVKKQITHTEVSLIAPATPAAERLHLLADLKHLSERKGNIETAIAALNRDHVRAQQELSDYRSFVAYNGPYPSAVTAPTNANY